MSLLDYAIDMEMDGMNFYNKLERTVEGKRLRTVCRSLAKDEENHAIILINKKDNIAIDLKKRPAIRVENVFGDPEDLGKNIDYAAQLDLYELALAKEQQSIDLYQKMLLEMPDDRDIKFLIKQEKEHYSLMEEIVKMVNRPNQWVEAAEFGVREEY